MTTTLARAEAMLAAGRRRAAARLLLAQGSQDAHALLASLPPDGPHGAALAERLRFGPPETWLGWRNGAGRVAVKLWPHAVPILPMSFRHAAIAPLIACGPTWRVNAWIEGETLARRLRGGVSADEGADLLADMERAVEALHAAGLAHGDLDAANVVVTPENRAVLIDWGEPGVADGAVEHDRHALARLAALLLTSPPPAASRS